MEQEDEERQPASRFPSYGDAVASVFGLHRPICMRSSVLARASRRRREPGASRRPAARLHAIGCSKLNLRVRDGNEAAVHFYASLGFGVEDRVSMSQLLEAAPDA